MISNFRSIVEGVVNSKKIEMTSFRKDRIRDIEKKLDGGEINHAESMRKLRDEFSYHLDNSDYRKIEKEVGYNL
jgi:hypothetical protein